EGPCWWQARSRPSASRWRASASVSFRLFGRTRLRGSAITGLMDRRDRRKGRSETGVLEVGMAAGGLPADGAGCGPIERRAPSTRRAIVEAQGRVHPAPPPERLFASPASVTLGLAVPSERTGQPWKSPSTDTSPRPAIAVTSSTYRSLGLRTTLSAPPAVQR